MPGAVHASFFRSRLSTRRSPRSMSLMAERGMLVESETNCYDLFR